LAASAGETGGVAGTALADPAAAGCDCSESGFAASSAGAGFSVSFVITVAGFVAA